MTKKKVVSKRKLEIVFDEKKRKEFLTGFQKRKNERRKRAKDELERNLKEERKRIRQEVKDGMKHLKKSFEPLKELTEEDKADEQQEYEDDDVKVKIVELSTNDLAAQRHMLGANQAPESESEEEQIASHNDDQELNANCIPGMDFDVNKARKRKLMKSEENDSPAKKSRKPNVEIKSKKDMDRFMKTKTMRKLKQSKVFRQKERVQKKENQKKARRDKNNTLKSLPKHQRKQKKTESSRYRKGRLINKRQARKKQKQ